MITMGPKIHQSQAFTGRLSAQEWAESGEWAKVVSSNVAAIRFDVKTNDLWVEFDGQGRRPNSVYVYSDVGLSRAKDMYMCSSMGRFVHQLKKSGFVGARIS